MGTASDDRPRVHVLNRLVGFGLVGVPLVVVFAKFSTFPAGEGFFATTAQVVATMYVAVALEYFTGDGVTLDHYARVEFLGLLAVSWLGLLASLRGLTGEGPGWASGLAAAGVVASIGLVTTSLGRRSSIQNPALIRPIVYVACFAPVLILLIP